MVRVLPEHRRQGVGGRIYEALSSTRAHSAGTRSGVESSRTTPSRGASSEPRISRGRTRVRGRARHGRGRCLGRTTRGHRARVAGRAARTSSRPSTRSTRGSARTSRGPRATTSSRRPFARWREQYLEGPGARAAGDDRCARRGRRRRLHGAPAARRHLADCGEHAHRGAPPLAQARHRNGAQARADLAGARGRHRADLHDERRDERRDARRQRAPRLPPGPDADRRQRPARRRGMP